MGTLTVAFLGDIFASPGRSIVRERLPQLREAYAPDLIIANAENARSGSGLSPALYRKLRDMGIDGMTLGDHCFRDGSIVSILEDPNEPIARPANLADRAAGVRMLRLGPVGAAGRSVFVITVLGRVFFPLPADDPFATVDAMLADLPERNPIVIVEAHMEATSEKNALGHYLDGRVSAVVGTHTHVQTADQRVLRNGTAFMTDLGMCGAQNSVIGRDIESVVRHMTTGMHVRFGLGEGDEVMCGAVIRIDEDTARATSIEPIRMA